MLNDYPHLNIRRFSRYLTKIIMNKIDVVLYGRNKNSSM